MRERSDPGPAAGLGRGARAAGDRSDDRANAGVVAIDWRVQVFSATVAILTAIAASAVPGDPRDARTDVDGHRRQRRQDHGLAGRCPRAARAGLDRGGAVPGAADGRRGVGPGPARFVAAQSRLRIRGRAHRANPAARGRLQDARAPQPPWCSGCSTPSARCRAWSSARTTQNVFVPGFSYQTLINIKDRPTPDGQPHTVQFRRVSADYFKTHADQDAARTRVHRR